MSQKDCQSKQTVTKKKEEQFVQYLFSCIERDKGVRARLRRADNPATEYQSWEILVPWVNLTNPYERAPYVVIAAAIARSGAQSNGSLGLGKALAKSFGVTNTLLDEDGPAHIRLRRLLAANDAIEVCRIIRPILRLIESRLSEPIDYARLLNELRFFNNQTKARWAQDFYQKSE